MHFLARGFFNFEFCLVLAKQHFKLVSILGMLTKITQIKIEFIFHKRDMLKIIETLLLYTSFTA